VKRYTTRVQTAVHRVDLNPIPVGIPLSSVVNKDLTFKAEAKDSKFVLEDIILKAKDNNTATVNDNDITSRIK